MTLGPGGAAAGGGGGGGGGAGAAGGTSGAAGAAGAAGAYPWPKASPTHTPRIRKSLIMKFYLNINIDYVSDSCRLYYKNV
jgi:hypothetical protein